MSSLKMRRMMTDYEQQIPEPELRNTHERREFNNVRTEIDIDDVIYEPPDSKTDQSLPILSESFCPKTFGWRDTTHLDGGTVGSNKRMTISHEGGRVEEVIISTYIHDRTQTTDLKIPSHVNNTSAGILDFSTTDLATGFDNAETVDTVLEGGGGGKVKVL